MKLTTRLRNRYIFRGLDIVHSNLNHGDAVAGFREFGLVFNRIKKAGNSTVVAFLSDLAAEERGRRALSVRDAKKSALKPSRCRWHEARSMRSYIWFTVVRNPYDRVLSAFLDKVAFDEEVTASGKKPFQDVPGRGEATPEGFAKFIGFLGEGGIHHDRHFWPQRELLIMPPGRYDLIGRLETLPEDMARLLTMIGRDPASARKLDKPHPLELAQPKKITGASAKRDSFYTHQLAAEVRRLYASDFETFGYPREMC